MSKISAAGEQRLRERIYRACLAYRGDGQRLTRLLGTDDEVVANGAQAHFGATLPLDTGLRHWNFDGSELRHGQGGKGHDR